MKGMFKIEMSMLIRPGVYLCMYHIDATGTSGSNFYLSIYLLIASSETLNKLRQISRLAGFYSKQPGKNCLRGGREGGVVCRVPGRGSNGGDGEGERLVDEDAIGVGGGG